VRRFICGGDAAAVAAVGLGLVERFVGARNQGDGVVVGNGFGESDAQGERFGAGDQVEAADGLVEPFRDTDSDVAWSLGQDEQELVATVAAEVIAPAQVLGDGFCHLAQSGIACGVALDIVDGFEVVDVDEGDGESLVAAAETLEFGGEFGLDAAPVERPGERVLLRFIAAASDQLSAGENEDEEAGDAE